MLCDIIVQNRFWFNFFTLEFNCHVIILILVTLQSIWTHHRSQPIPTKWLTIFNPLQVFSKAKVMFSIGGRFYNGPTLSYSYMPDRVLENARNVSINLHQKLARFVKLRLFFADRWVMLSEVVFDSGKPDFLPAFGKLVANSVTAARLDGGIRNANFKVWSSSVRADEPN